MKMPTKSSCLFLIAAIIILSKSATAQAEFTAYNIYGSVADSSTKKSLAFITIQLKTASDSIVKTNLTTADGSFTFSELKPQIYFIQIVAVGYLSKAIVVDFTGSIKKSTNLGSIYLSNKVNTLGEVTVTARKQLVKQEIDRITYDMQADPESKGSSVLEMMRKVPFLSVDGDGNILLNGSSGYKILINGKPSSMLERNGKDMLRSMPASTIKSIEVITNPSSKYDAEGLAGIINIITIKKVDNGYSGTINVSHKFPAGGPGAGGSFALKKGKFGLSALAGAGLYNSPQTGSFMNRMTKGSSATNLEQNSTRQSDSRSAYFGSEVSYEIDSLNLISAQFNSNGSRTDGISYQKSLLYGTSGVLQHYNLTNNNAGNGKGMDLALNYQLGFKKSKERLLTFSYRYMAYTNGLFNSLDVSDAVNFAPPDYHQANEGRFSEQTFQADYVHPIKKLNVEGGIKGILRNNKSDYQYHLFDSAGGKFELDPTRTDNFNNQQNIFAAYNTYQYTLNDWGFKAGLRIEQTSVDAHFISGTAHVTQQYLNLIPAASVNRRFNDRSSLTLNYTNRIQRPGINHLNPFIDRSNPSFESTGNPNLKPAFSNVVQLSYNSVKKAAFNIALGYMRFKNLIGPVFTYDSAAKVTRRTYQSAGKARILKTNLYVSYPLTKNWNMRLNSDIRYVTSQIEVNKNLVLNEGWTANLNVFSGYRFKDWRANADVTLNTGGISGLQAKSNSFVSSTFGIQKDFFKSHLTLSASVSNPFSQYRRNHEKMFGPDFTQVNTTEIYYRAFNVSVNYRFGKLKEAIRKTKRTITNDDVSN